MDGLDEEKVDKFLSMLMDLGHASPVEHVVLPSGLKV